MLKPGGSTDLAVIPKLLRVEDDTGQLGRTRQREPVHGMEAGRGNPDQGDRLSTTAEWAQD